MDKLSDFARMIAWLLAGIALQVACKFVGADDPVLQTVLRKLGNVTLLSWFAYWIARTALGRVVTPDKRRHFLDHQSDPIELLARAVIMAGVIIAGSLGL